MEEEVAAVLGLPFLALCVSLTLGILSLSIEKRRGQDVTADLFFTGNRQLRTVPMAASLITTIVTPLSWLTLPAIVARHGITPVVATSLGIVVATPIALFVFLPVFFSMQPTTAFEYLEQRFSTAVKLLASGLFVCLTLTSLPARLYVPIYALNEVVKQLPMLYAGPIVLVFALTYTALGGMRALQWASCFHVLVSFAAVSIVVALGSQLDSGENAWEILFTKQSRLLAITLEDWGAGLGAAFFVGSQLVAGQQQVQRYLSVPLLSQANTAIVLALVGVLLFGALQLAAGLLMATHEALPTSELACDEHSFSHYTAFLKFSLMVVSGVPALNGLVVAGLCSVVLSSLANGVHALAAVLIVDVWGLRNKTRDLPVSRGRWLMALASFLVLLASALMIYIPEPLLSVALMFPRITGGPLLGLFSLGMLIPWANTTGAIVGAILSLAVAWWAAWGTSLVNKLTTENIAAAMVNVTVADPQSGESGCAVPVPSLCPLGCAVTLVVGALVSALVRPRDPRTLDPDLVSPLTRWIHSRIWSWNIGDTFEDSSSVKDDFQYEAVPTSQQSVAMVRGVREAVRRQAWPDIAYPHLSRRTPPTSVAERPRSGLAWDQTTGSLYLSMSTD